MAKTLRERFIAALEKAGERKIKTTSRFEVFTNASGGHYYVGRSGSLRVGQNIQDSIPVSEKRRQSMLDQG